MSKVTTFLDSSVGKGKIASGASVGYVGQQISAAATDLASTIENGLPDSLKGSVLVSSNVEFGTGQTKEAKITAEIGGTLFRSSLEPSKYGGVDNIIALFSKGWSYPSYKAPCGYWHGQFTYARTKKEADPFVARAVEDWRVRWEGKIEIKSVRINSSYT